MNTNQNRSLFVPMLPPIVFQPKTSVARDYRSAGQPVITNLTKGNNNKMLNNNVSNLAKAWNAIPQDVKTEAMNKGKAYVSRKFAGSSPGRGNNGGGLSLNHSSGYALSKAPSPLPITLDTGVVPNTYTSDYLVPIENDCSPLHISSGVITFPTTVGNALQDYFTKVISFDLQTKSQANVGFNVNITTDFTATNILAAMNTLLNALQIYFFYMSIISYHSNPENKNQGMIALRQSITPQMIEDLSILGRRLADTPCPPKLLELVRYISGTFSSGQSQGSPLLKIVPHYLSGTTVVLASSISAATTALSTSANNSVYTLLRRTVPQWCPKILYDAPTDPLFDLNFISIFANLPFIVHDQTGGVYCPFPTVTSKSDVIRYNSFTNTLDGVAFALTSAYNTTDSTWIPGLIIPPAGSGVLDNNNSRRSYYNVGGTMGFYDVYQYPFLIKARSETYYSTSTIAVAHGHLFGADKCLNVTADTIRETCMKAIDYLMSAETIKNEKSSGFNKSSGTSDRKRRPKSKSK